MNFGVALTKQRERRRWGTMLQAKETACAKGRRGQSIWNQVQDVRRFGLRESKVQRKDRLEPADLESPLKSLLYIKSEREPPKGFKLQSFGRIRRGSNAIWMYTVSHLLGLQKWSISLILPINPQVGIVNTSVRKKQPRGLLDWEFCVRSRTALQASCKGQSQDLKAKKKKKKEEERKKGVKKGDRQGTNVCPDWQKGQDCILKTNFNCLFIVL